MWMWVRTVRIVNQFSTLPFQVKIEEREMQESRNRRRWRRFRWITWRTLKNLKYGRYWALLDRLKDWIAAAICVEVHYANQHIYWYLRRVDSFKPPGRVVRRKLRTTTSRIAEERFMGISLLWLGPRSARSEMRLEITITCSILTKRQSCASQSSWKSWGSRRSG